jgi:hypothetical protein
MAPARSPRASRSAARISCARAFGPVTAMVCRNSTSVSDQHPTCCQVSTAQATTVTAPATAIAGRAACHRSPTAAPPHATAMRIPTSGT